MAALYQTADAIWWLLYQTADAIWWLLYQTADAIWWLLYQTADAIWRLLYHAWKFFILAILRWFLKVLVALVAVGSIAELVRGVIAALTAAWLMRTLSQEEGTATLRCSRAQSMVASSVSDDNDRDVRGLEQGAQDHASTPAGPAVDRAEPGWAGRESGLAIRLRITILPRARRMVSVDLEVRRMKARTKFCRATPSLLRCLAGDAEAGRDLGPGVASLRGARCDGLADRLSPLSSVASARSCRPGRRRRRAATRRA